MNKTLLKVIGISATVFLLLNLVLFALGKMNVWAFWIVIIIGAVLAFVVVPRMKKN